MYEHPYLAYTVSEHDQEQIRQAADRRFFLEEHADQIVPRAAGRVRLFGRRMLRALTGSPARALAETPSDGRTADASPSAARGLPAGCEPAPAR